MNENEIVDMGKRLKEKFEALEKKEKEFYHKVAITQKYLAVLYTYGRELDMLTGVNPEFPLIIKYMVERIRGITSALLFYDPEDVDEELSFLHIRNANT